MVIVDTSVIAKWFLPELDSPAALMLRDAHLKGSTRIAIPDFALIELGNVLRFKFPPSEVETPAGVVRFLSSMGAQIIATSP